MERLTKSQRRAGVITLIFFALMSPLHLSLADNLEENHTGLDDSSEYDPCDLSSLYPDNPQDVAGFCYCNELDVKKNEEEVTCNFHRNPTDKDWRAIAQFSSLTSIQFINRPPGAIRRVPQSYVFVGMKSLLYFKMKMADLGTIPSFAFGNSSSLGDIDLSDSNIQVLARNAFANLYNLTHINLKENRLSEISRDVFVNLHKLRQLELMKNQIQVVHDYAFKDLKNLKDLALQYNNISVVSREAFVGLGKMKFLDLQGNRIEYIGDHSFAEMSRLEDLDLSKNQIISISPAAFAGLSALTRLNLKDNKIVKLHTGTFSYFNVIHFLDLRSNELETLTVSLMKPIQHRLKHSNMQLLVEDNRFSCDCRILWMKTLFKETASDYVKHHLLKTTCDMFVNPNKNVAAASRSTAFFQKQGDYSNVTILSNPPEETTTYAFESVRDVVNLTAEEFNCRDDEDGGDDDERQRKLSGNNAASDSIYKHLQMDKSPPSGSSHQHHDHQHHQPSNDGSQGDGSLKEPQATAALDGSEGRSGPSKIEGTANQKIDTSRASATHGLLSPKPSGSPSQHCGSLVVPVSVGIVMVFLLRRRV